MFLDTPLKKSWVVLLKNAGGDVNKTTIYTALREVFEPLLEVYVYIYIYIFFFLCVASTNIWICWLMKSKASEHTEEVQHVSL